MALVICPECGKQISDKAEKWRCQREFKHRFAYPEKPCGPPECDKLLDAVKPCIAYASQQEIQCRFAEKYQRDYRELVYHQRNAVAAAACYPSGGAVPYLGVGQWFIFIRG